MHTTTHKKPTKRSKSKTDGGEGSAAAAGIACGTGTAMVLDDHDDDIDLEALPEGCKAKVISLTTPKDAGRLSLVSRSFRSAADSDAVWGRFLGPQSVQPPPLFQPQPPSASKSMKELYLTLCPVLNIQGTMSFSLDKWSGKKCYMISARALTIIWGTSPEYWRWISRVDDSEYWEQISLPNSRFEEVAELLIVWWLEIRGKIDTRRLSPSTLYKTYLVFKFNEEDAYGFDDRPLEVTVGVEGEEPIRRTVFLQPTTTRIEETQYPKDRADDWLEVELGEFFCQGGGDGMLEMSCMETRSGQVKRGLIVHGIEVRPKLNQVESS